MRVRVLLWALFVGVIVAPAECVHTIKEKNDLVRKLLKDYRRNTLPISDFNDQFVVNITAYPIAVGDIDEVEEELATVLGLTMTWTDSSIQWDPAKHNNITNITLGLNEVWKPELMLVNPHQKEITGHLDVSSTGISYNHLGATTWLSRVTLHTTCDIVTTYFPFDVQTCFINIRLAGNDAYMITVDASWEKHFTKENGAWKIDQLHIHGSEWSFITIDFVFARKPMYMMVNILLPIIILALLTPLVFMMPKSSGERLGYSVTMMLSISVYMTIVSDHLPKNSDPMPLISILIFVWYILNALIVLIVILNIKISHSKDNSRIPRFVRAFVRLTRRISCKKTLSTSASSEETEKCLKDIGETEKCLKDTDEDENENNCRDNSTKITWMEVSVAIDRWCLVVIYIIKFVVPAVFIAVVSTKQRVRDVHEF